MRLSGNNATTQVCPHCPHCAFALKNIPAEWHFSATSHGKGACDGVGRTVKHLAARASLQRPYDEQIMAPRYLYEWAQKDIPAVYFHYCTQEEYNAEKCHLEDRFAHCRPIVGTQSSLSRPDVKNTTGCSFLLNSQSC